MIAVDRIAQELKLRNARLWAFSGGTVAPLFDACHRYNIEVIITRSEFGAGMAAIGAFKASGRMQFVAATSGPGATNLVTPIAEAYYDSCPIIFLTGQAGTSNLVGVSRQKGFQQTPIAEIVRPITKMAVQPTSPSNLVSSFKAATQFATAGRGGPCLIDMCMDLQKGEVSERSLAYSS